MAVGEVLELEIQRLAFGGEGISSWQGKVCFVSGALPGQKVKAILTENKSRFSRAKTVAVLDHGQHLTKAPCPIADRCGGCPWQKASITDQEQWKERLLKDALQRIGGYPEESYRFQFWSSPKTFAYRNRIRLQLTLLPDKGLQFAFYAADSHQLVPTQSCLIAEEPIQELMSLMQSLAFPKLDRVERCSLELQVLRAEQTQVLWSIQDASPKCLAILRQWYASQPLLQEKVLWPDSEELLWEIWEDLRFYTKPGQFQQVNRLANHRARSFLLEFKRAHAIETVLDLYCGSGNLSLALAKAGAKVLGLESWAPSIASAKRAVSANRLDGKARYEAKEAKHYQQLLSEFKTIDLILCDPPRRGLAEIVPDLLKAPTRWLIYMSCDPNTLARDLHALKAQYELREVIGMDFFPHSYHIETLCILERKAGGRP